MTTTGVSTVEREVYYLIDDRINYEKGPFFTEREAIQTRNADRTTDGPEIESRTESLKPKVLGMNNPLSEIFDSLEKLASEEFEIEVPVYRSDDTIVSSDPVTTVTLYAKVNGRTGTFWFEDACECCETRPEIEQSRDIGNINAFNNRIKNFIQRYLNGHAPRKYAGGDGR